MIGAGTPVVASRRRLVHKGDETIEGLLGPAERLHDVATWLGGLAAVRPIDLARRLRSHEPAG